MNFCKFKDVPTTKCDEKNFIGVVVVGWLVGWMFGGSRKKANLAKLELEMKFKDVSTTKCDEKKLYRGGWVGWLDGWRKRK